MNKVQRFHLKWTNAIYAIKHGLTLIGATLVLLICFVLLLWTWRISAAEKPKIITIMPKDRSDDDSWSDVKRREKIKKMMLHAWGNYKLFTWGLNELRPISRHSHVGGNFGANKLGATIVESLDTLYIMGLEEEYKLGRDWVESTFTLDNINRAISVYDLTSSFLGSMLTLYSFTGDSIYLKKAVHIADKLLPAFKTSTGIPYPKINPKTGIDKDGIFGYSVLSEFGALHLEFYYLSDLTGNATYRERVENIRNVLRTMDKPDGIYPVFLKPTTGKWGRRCSSLGKLGGRFYDYLLKSWMQSGYTDKISRQMYGDAILAVMQNMFALNPKGQAFITDWKYGNLTQHMEQFSCFSGGLFALTAVQGIVKHSSKYAEMAMSITNICSESFRLSPTHLGPEVIAFTNKSQNDINVQQKLYYTLRPEIIESYFVLWRLTHEQKYRDWGWDIVEALEKYCWTPNGYTGLQNVFDNEQPEYDDVQRSVFLAQTLKYLFLLFSDDSVMPLEEWVFNSGGHPMPIKGENIHYRKVEI